VGAFAISLIIIYNNTYIEKPGAFGDIPVGAFCIFLIKRMFMAYSMTGFGRSEKIFGTRRYNIEMKSVN